MKHLTRKGVGTTKKQAEPILQEEEIMWLKGLLGDKDPKTLLYTLVFLFGKFFALRSGGEHRQLTFSQLKIIEGTSTERTRLQYKSHDKKNQKLLSSMKTVRALKVRILFCLFVIFLFGGEFNIRGEY